MTTKNNYQVIRLALLLGLFSTPGPFTIDMYLPAFPEIVKQFDTTASLVAPVAGSGFFSFTSWIGVFVALWVRSGR